MKSYRYKLAALLLCFGIGARAANVVTISSVEGAPDEEVTVSIGLQNSDALSSLQVSIPLDENLILVDETAQVGSRCSSHALTVGVKDGMLNVFVYSLSMAPITDTNGEVASFKLKLGYTPTTIALTPTKTVLTDTNGTVVSSSAQGGDVTIRCAKAQYSTMEVDFGEVPIRSSYEQTVTVQNVGNADLTITELMFSDVNVFSSTTSLPITLKPGASRELNITYAPVERGSISKTLKVACNSISKLNTVALKASPFAINELHVQDASGISDEEVTVPMTMNNMDAISGYQVEFDLPEQFQFVENSFMLSTRKQDHVSTTSLNGQKLRIIVYSPTDKPLTGDDGVIGSFKVKLMGRYGAMLTPTKTVLSATINNKVENVVSAVYGGEVDVSSPQIGCDDQMEFGAVSVTEVCERTFSISNYGNAPLTISRVTFDNEYLSVKETLPLVIPTDGNADVTVVHSSVEQKAFEATMHIYSNDPDLRMKDVALNGSRFAPNYVVMRTPKVYVDENVKIEVDLNVYDDVSGLQFDLIYPSQYYDTFDGHVTLESRAEGMSVTHREIDGQTIRYFCYFLNGQNIPAGNGKLMTIQLRPKNGTVAERTYLVEMKNVKVGVSELTDKYAGNDLQSTLQVKQHAPVTISAKSYTRLYGDDNPAFEFTSEGATVVGQPAFSCEATATSPIGEYAIVISKGGVENEEDSYVNGVLTITKAPLTVTVQSCSREQGGENPAFEVAYSGWKNNEDESVLLAKPVATTTATRESPVGEYPITLSGGEAQNYNFIYSDGVLTITVTTDIKAMLTFGEPFDVYNVSGQKVRSQITSLRHLPRGVYMIGGMKVVIR